MCPIFLVKYEPGRNAFRVMQLSYHQGSVRGGSRISGKGVHIYKGEGVRFADFTHVS